MLKLGEKRAAASRDENCDEAMKSKCSKQIRTIDLPRGRQNPFFSSLDIMMMLYRVQIEMK